MTRISPPTQDVPVDEPSVNGTGPTEESTQKVTADIFDPEYSVDDEETLGIEKAIITIPVRKPRSTEFFRVHPEFVTDRYVLNLREGMDEFVYLISAELKDLVPENVRKARIYPTINKFGTVALWRVNYPWEGSRRGRKSFDTAVAAADRAKTAWTRAVWNRDTGSYDVLIAKGDLGMPRWPDMNFRDMLATAFDGLVIDRADHEVLRELAGEQ
ncbi:MAG: hypothetical protein ACLP9Y_13695 [Mycobacterium sp.]